ncbi:hypothetical protein C7S20_11245 [Christiangramia fulva]|uniref:Uncharacterized protein n=1 Tax=Christiangramia fulva TaxID=2126553 RepID=A0A2R3Z6B1_9FLAO|nr:hypothetical protein [Christiangramia fulva]AVR45778.1 hypothetical protein C7S20_11245 [Christiangramia fulva]
MENKEDIIDPEIEHQKPPRNTWNLILGMVFLCYGAARLYQRVKNSSDDTFGIILAVAFILFGIYDLYKYFSRK